MLSRPIPPELIATLAAAPLVEPHEIKMWEACGGRIVYARYNTRWGDERGPVVHHPPSWLTEMERLVLRELAAGKTPKEIAFATGLSYSGVGTSMRRLRFKLKATTNEQAIFHAVLRGFLNRDGSVRREPRVNSIHNLTPRLRDVLERIAGGMTRREIAKDLSVSEETVKHTMTQLKRIYNANSSPNMVLLAMRAGHLE